MQIAVVGLNHNTADTEIREKAAFSDMKKLEVINYLLDCGVEEAIVLSTCNRSEIYITGSEGKLSQYVTITEDYYKKLIGENAGDGHLYSKQGQEALYHLYSVAAGLDSIVIGEDQILGQLKDAHSFAMSIGSSKKMMNKIFREAISTAKNIKTQLKISEQPLSISYIGVKFLKEKLGSLKDKSIFIIGLGKMGRLALKYMLEEGAEKIYASYRNKQNIIDLLEEYPQITAVDYKNRYEIIRDIDILITATACPHLIIKEKELAKLSRELTVLDLAIPRDVDAAVGSLENVRLYNVDALKATAAENEKIRENLSEKAREIIMEDIKVLKQWLSVLKADPVIKSLREKCENIQAETLEYIFGKLDLDNKEKKIIEKMLGSALKRLIREPILKLKEADSEEKSLHYAKMLEELYDLNETDES